MARMPYTNFHDINLDWIIKRVMKAYTPDNPPDYPVKSVNSKTGHVVLDSDDIQDIDSGLDLTDALRKKQNRPESTGTAGQVLGLDNDLQPVWINQGGGGVTDFSQLTGIPAINSVRLVSGNRRGSFYKLIDAPTTAGTAGQVLTSNGNNGQTWETVINDNADGIVTNQTWSASKIIQELGTVVDGLNDKIDKPETQGTAGQVLGLDNNLDPVWINQSGGGSADNWELINTFIPSEDVNLININTDSNGNPFNLKKCLVFIEMQSSNTTSNNQKISCGFNVTGIASDIDITNCPDINVANIQYAFCYGEADQTFKRTSWSYPNVDITAVNQYSNYSTAKTATVIKLYNNYITNFTIRINTSTITFDHTKTKFKIYGVKA